MHAKKGIIGAGISPKIKTPSRMRYFHARLHAKPHVKPATLTMKPKI
jgi:hypothetical protein